MNFKELLLLARAGDQSATMAILEMYNPLLVKESILDGIFDEDLYQELRVTAILCIRKFPI